MGEFDAKVPMVATGDPGLTAGKIEIAEHNAGLWTRVREHTLATVRRNDGRARRSGVDRSVRGLPPPTRSSSPTSHRRISVTGLKCCRCATLAKILSVVPSMRQLGRFVCAIGDGEATNCKNWAPARW
jgi:hypothetical protein